jgi:hypothetical protein
MEMADKSRSTQDRASKVTMGEKELGAYSQNRRPCRIAVPRELSDVRTRRMHPRSISPQGM